MFFSLSIATQILIAWLLADFVTGLIHWFEDKYMDAQSLNFLAADIAEDNDLHHRKPTAMLASSYWENMRSGAAVGFPLACVLWLIGAPLWLWLFPFFAAFGNLVHRFAHTPERQLGPFVRFMQSTGLFLRYGHHDAHHRSMLRLIPKHEAGFRFCPMTEWVNPVLDGVKFWDGLEFVLSKIGIQPVKKNA